MSNVNVAFLLIMLVAMTSKNSGLSMWGHISINLSSQCSYQKKVRGSLSASLASAAVSTTRYTYCVFFLKNRAKFAQHTPVVSGSGKKNAGVLISHDQFLELLEESSLQRFGHKITDHFIGGTEFNYQIPFFNLVHQKEITDVKGTSMLTGAALTIFK